MENKNNFLYGDRELNYLKSRDKKLGLVIDKLGMLKREIRSDKFESLVMSIVSQQLSSKAADSIWMRLEEKYSAISAEILADADLNDLRQCGMSIRKAGYVQALAIEIMSGSLNFGEFASMSDENIIAKLSSLPGIGVWTAEMFLIFSMCRMDIVSFGDLAIRRGMMNLYGLKELTKEQFEKYRKRYSPCGTVASFYIWALS